MDDQGEGSGASGREDQPPGSTSRKSSKTKLKKRTAQRRSRFPIGVLRKSSNVDDGGGDGDDEDDSREQTPDSTTDNEATGASRTESQKLSKEMENTEKKLGEILSASANETSVDPQQGSNTPTEVDYDDYSTQQDFSHSRVECDSEAGGDNSTSSWYSLGASVSSYFGQFTTQAWSFAKTTWQTYQDYMLASDSEDDWGESKEESSDEDEINFEDAAEELGVSIAIKHLPSPA